MLSLVHLEFINDEEIFHNEGFTISDVNKLNQSKSARIWMLSHVLQILGISCKPGNLPELTPMYLMARNMVSRPTIYFQFVVLSITKVYYIFHKNYLYVGDYVLSKRVPLLLVTLLLAVFSLSFSSAGKGLFLTGIFFKQLR